MRLFGLLKKIFGYWCILYLNHVLYRMYKYFHPFSMIICFVSWFLHFLYRALCFIMVSLGYFFSFLDFSILFFIIPCSYIHLETFPWCLCLEILLFLGKQKSAFSLPSHLDPKIRTESILNRRLLSLLIFLHFQIFLF